MKLRLASPEPAVVNGKAGKRGERGVIGPPGLSAYDLACRNGFTGSLHEWLESIRGKQGEQGVGLRGKQGERGETGFDGWSPVLAVIPDGERRVLKIIGWIGGAGQAPESGQYLGPTGAVRSLQEATDIRGPAGPKGRNGGIKIIEGQGGSGIDYVALDAALNLSDLTDAAEARDNLGLDTAATAAIEDFDPAGAAASVAAGLGTVADDDTGTSGHTIPFLDGANTWSERQIFANARVFGDTSYVLTGSIDTTASASVVGVGTLFTTELEPGQYINVSGTYRRVESITDDTHLTVDVAFTDLANDTSVDAYPLLWSAYIQGQTAPAWVLQDDGVLRARGAGRLQVINAPFTVLGAINVPQTYDLKGQDEDVNSAECALFGYSIPVTEKGVTMLQSTLYGSGAYSSSGSHTFVNNNFNVYLDGAAAASGSITAAGIQGSVLALGASVLSTLYASSCAAQVGGTTTVATLTSNRSLIGASGFTGTVTDARAVHAAFSGSGGTWTNVYGVYVDAIPFGTNQYAFYSAGDEPARFGGDVIAVSSLRAGTSIQLNDVPGAANSYVCRQFLKTGIADAVATAVITVTVPNGNHNGVLKMRLISVNGSTDASESTRTAECSVIIARVTGADTAKTDVSIGVAGIATVGSGATHTLAYATSALTGASGATQTFTVNITIDDNGNVGGNEIMILAELHNKNASGITMAAA